MDPITLGLIGFTVAVTLIALRVPIGFALGGMAILCTYMFYGFKFARGEGFEAARALRPTMSLVGSNVFEFLHSYPLSMIPMFIALGHLAFHAGITTEIYNAGRVWLAKIPGGLAMASAMGCGGFSAITGSSIACAAAMGRICIPEMQRNGYDMRLASSTVAVGGTLGSLIPPSVLFIIYGLFTETSVNRLFLAGVVPGLMSLVGFLIVIWLWTRVNPSVAPVPDEQITMADRWRATGRSWPALMLFTIIIGGIYGGIFNATEAAAVCVSFALIYGVITRRLDGPKIRDAMRETAIQTGAIFFIAAGAKMFVAFVSLTGVTREFVALTEAAGLSNLSILLAIVALYLVMGMFLDPLGIMLLTLPFVVPLVEGMGMDLIWFGVVVVKLLEIGLITPPMGLNVFIINSVIGRDAPVHTIFRGVINFLAMDLVVFGLILAFPALSLWLAYSAF